MSNDIERDVDIGNSTFIGDLAIGQQSSLQTAALCPPTHIHNVDQYQYSIIQTDQ